MLGFVEKLTLRPSEMVQDDCERLRSSGFDNGAILDIVLVTGLFAYFNRLADGLGIDLEPEMPADSRRG